MMAQTTIVPFLELFFGDYTPSPHLVLQDKHKRRKTVAVVEETRTTYTVNEHAQFALFFGVPYGIVYKQRELQKSSPEIVEHPAPLRASK